MQSRLIKPHLQIAQSENRYVKHITNIELNPMVRLQRYLKQLEGVDLT